MSRLVIFVAMFKKITCVLLAGLFLISGTVLPLGDFSLLRDIPQMYRNYSKITSVEEAGVLDFIGDYLFHGKEILGHNSHDKTPAKGNEVQFQHQASPLSVIFLRTLVKLDFTNEYSKDYIIPLQDSKIPGYRNKLFRPPLV